jgi:hypothetical protein
MSRKIAQYNHIALVMVVISLAVTLSLTNYTFEENIETKKKKKRGGNENNSHAYLDMGGRYCMGNGKGACNGYIKTGLRLAPDMTAQIPAGNFTMGRAPLLSQVVSAMKLNIL